MEYECTHCGHTYGGEDNNSSLWIKTTERLPEQDEDILFVKEEPFKHCVAGYFLPGDVFCEWGTDALFTLWEVSHWMPYPELPKE